MMKCRECRSPILAVDAEVDPREMGHAFKAQCGHRLTLEETRELWEQGLRWTVPVVDGASLGAAERYRQVHEEGFTPEHDAAHDPNDLPWAAWSLLDAAMADGPVEEPPKMWPFEPERWKAEHTPLRRLVIAQALIAAEIDRRLRTLRARQP